MSHKRTRRGASSLSVMFARRRGWTRYETYGAENVIPSVVDGKWEDVSTPPLGRYQSAAIATDAIEKRKKGEKTPETK